MNFVECHILSGMHREYNLSIVKVRPALRNLIKLRPSLHPLLEWHLKLIGSIYSCVQPGDELIDLNNPKQKVLTEILEINIERIERNAQGTYVSYPFVGKRSRQEPKIIMINPAISFGRPVISGTGIPTSVIASRFHALSPYAIWLRNMGGRKKKWKK